MKGYVWLGCVSGQRARMASLVVAAETAPLPALPFTTVPVADDA